MAHLVLARDVAIGLLGLHYERHARLDRLLILAEREEDRADIRALHVSQLGAISLFLGKCEFVSLDSVLLVVFDAG